jgi:Tfp pilus assembly protein PilF
MLIAHLVVSAVVAWGGATSAQTLTPQQSRESLDHFRNGMDALLTERYERAETELQGAVKIDPLFDAAFYGLGQTYMRMRRYDRAITAYLQSREAFKQNAARQAMGGFESDQQLQDRIKVLKDQQQALERTSQAGSSSSVPQAISRVRDQINILESRKGRNIQGTAAPVPAGISLALGSAYFRAGNMADAEREYKAAIEVDPKFGEAHSNLAVVYMTTDRPDLAGEEVKAAEKAGFKVNPQLKDDLKKMKKG